MMHTWFECKIRYEKVMENGMNKKVTEPYLVDALSFTEAEARIIEEITPYISGEFTVSDIKRANYSELFPSEEDAADRWFKCKLFFITLDGQVAKMPCSRRSPYSLKHGILFLFSPNPLIKIGHFHYLALYSTFHHTCFLETFQDQIQYNDRNDN